MKNLLLGIILVSLPMTGSSQIFYNGNQVSSSRIIGKGVGNIAGAYLTFGLSAANSSRVVEGETAETTIKEKRPIFALRFESKSDSLFMDKKNVEDIVLVKLKEKKDARNIITGKYGLVAGVKTGLDNKYVIPINIDNTEKESEFVIKLKEDLSKGEYGFYYIGNDFEYNKIWDFNVK